MNDFVIITDSGCDLPANVVETYNIEVVPMGLEIDNKLYKHYPDYRELSIEEFYKKIDEGHIGKTSSVSVGDVEDVMRKHAQEGKDILYLSFSSGLSGSFQASFIAGQQIKSEFPNITVEVLDTLCGSIGLGFITTIAAQMKQNNKTLSEIVDYIKNNCKHICHYFMVDNLKYIHKTGRISALSSIAGTAMGIKPIFHLSNEGRVALTEKVRGRKAAIKALVKNLANHCVNSSKILIGYCNTEDDAKTIKEELLTVYPDAEIDIYQVGPILGNNVGPGALAISFIGNIRE